VSCWVKRTTDATVNPPDVADGVGSRVGASRRLAAVLHSRLIGEQIHQNWGCTYADSTSGTFEAYRLFLRGPLYWTNGVVGKFQNIYYADGGGSGNVADLSILTLYYAGQ